MSNSKPTSAADSRSPRFWGVVASAVVVAALAGGLRFEFLELVRGLVGSSSTSAAVTPSRRRGRSRQAGRDDQLGMPAGAIDHLEPTLWYYATTWEIAYATCTPLMTFEDTSGAAGVKPIPGVGQQPTVSDGGLGLQVHAEAGARFLEWHADHGSVDQVHVRPDVLAEARLAG